MHLQDGVLELVDSAQAPDPPKSDNVAATSPKAMSFRRPRFEAQETMGSSMGRVRFTRLERRVPAPRRVYFTARKREKSTEM
jgi:hypothetical protein